MCVHLFMHACYVLCSIYYIHIYIQEFNQSLMRDHTNCVRVCVCLCVCGVCVYVCTSIQDVGTCVWLFGRIGLQKKSQHRPPTIPKNCCTIYKEDDLTTKVNSNICIANTKSWDEMRCIRAYMTEWITSPRNWLATRLTGLVMQMQRYPYWYQLSHTHHINLYPLQRFPKQITYTVRRKTTIEYTELDTTKRTHWLGTL